MSDVGVQANGTEANKPRRGRPPKTKTPPSNEIAMTEDQRIALHFSHVNQVRKRKAELESAKGRYRNALAAAKAELGESGKKDVLQSLEMETNEGEAKAKETVDRIIRVARWHGAPIGAQLSLLDTIPARDLRAEGKIAGLQAKSAIPPEGLSQADAQVWLEGWHLGQAVHVEGFGRVPGPLGDAQQKAAVAEATAKAEEAANGAANDDERDLRPPYARPENQAGPAIGDQPATTRKRK